MLRPLDIGSLVRLGPGDEIYSVREWGTSPVFLEEYEHGIVIKIQGWETAVFVGNQVWNVVGEFKNRRIR